MEKKIEDDPMVRMSICTKCNNPVRVAVIKSMTDKSSKNFYSEVARYELLVKEVALSKFKSDCNSFCECEISKKDKRYYQQKEYRERVKDRG